MNNDIKYLWKYSALDLVDLIKNKEISPHEVFDSVISRIEEINPSINAIVEICEERARKSIKEKELNFQNTLLKSLPVLVKDNTEVSGVKTTYGSKIFENNISETSDPMIKKIESNGGVILGKTNLPEFAAGSHTYNDLFGYTANPWNLNLSAGGSSGGSAAAVASGMGWFSTGNDLGGSLRNPASWCGVVGLRPTPGLIPQRPYQNIYDSIIVSGPIARNVSDLALFLDAMKGYDIDDPLSINTKKITFTESIQAEVNENYKIGITKNFGLFDCDPEVNDMIDNSAKLINSLGFDIEESYPSMDGAEECFQNLRAYIFYLKYGYLLKYEKNSVKEEILWNVKKGKSLSIDQLVYADKVRASIYKKMISFFNNYDFLIAPSSAVTPFDLSKKWVKKIGSSNFDNYVSWLMITACISLTGCPSIALSTAISKNGAPFGIQIVAAPHQEEKLLKFAKIIESNINISQLIPVDLRQ